MQSCDLMKRSSREIKLSRHRHHRNSATVMADSDMESEDSDAQDARSISLDTFHSADEPPVTVSSSSRYATDTGDRASSQSPSRLCKRTNDGSWTANTTSEGVSGEWMPPQSGRNLPANLTPSQPHQHDFAVHGAQPHHLGDASRLTFTPPTGIVTLPSTNQIPSYSIPQNTLMRPPNGPSELARWTSNKYPGGVMSDVGETGKAVDLGRENAGLKMYCEKLKSAIHHRDIVISELQAEVQDLQQQ
ncbi:hypothetical protein HK096_010184, partial [Nowakowskiella sp. JEL0078]